MVKLQQYFIFKLSTDRLKADNYDILLTPDQARRNGELVSIGDSQMLRSLRKIKNQTDKKEELKELLLAKKKWKTQENKYGLMSLYDIENKIDKILFVPEIISLVVKNVKHYEHIIKKGLFINNKKFVRLMCSAGQARRNNVLLIDSEYEIPLKKILNNDRANIEITPAKFNAYFALSSSTALKVSTPYFCVIPDCEITRKEKVEWVTETDGDDSIQEIEKDIIFNLFDGQGIVSPRMAQVWANDLELDYIPSCFIIRANFIKGMVCVIDFMKFSDEVGSHIIKDIYGNDVNIRDMDIILTASQFKLWNAFSSTEDYVKKCEKNNLSWGITRYSPKEENSHTFLNYQFLQALHLDEKQIESLCKKTVEYFENTMSNKLDYTLLYLLGDIVNREYDPNIFDKINDNITKAIMLDNNLINDPYIQSHIQNSLKKKIKDSYIGNILVDGQYTMMVADPYAFMEYVFGMEPKGLLGKDEHYNNYWYSKGADKIAGMRSPLTWRSEVDILNLKNNDNISEWYQYLNNCCVFNIHGVDMALLGGGDLDGDIICLTSQQEIIDGAYGGLPIMYETRKAPKSIIVESELYKADLKGFNTKVGFLTNLSTTMYAMLPKFEKDSKQYEEIIRRLKQCRKEQGSIIDATKGLDIKPIPPHWTNWQKITDDMTKEEKEVAEFNNSIIINKRPMFMIYLYPNYGKEYRQYCNDYDVLSQAKFKLFLNDLLLMDKELLNDEQEEFIKQFYYYNPLLDTSCEINNISYYMQKKIQEIKIQNKLAYSDDMVEPMKKKGLGLDRKKSDFLNALHTKYKSGKRNFGNIKNEDGSNRWQTIEQYNKSIRQEALIISSDIGELAYYAIAKCYILSKSDNKEFVWSIFGDGVIDNLKENSKTNKIEIPFLDSEGDIEFLGRKYSKKEIYINGETYDFL